MLIPDAPTIRTFKNAEKSVSEIRRNLLFGGDDANDEIVPLADQQIDTEAQYLFVQAIALLEQATATLGQAGLVNARALAVRT